MFKRILLGLLLVLFNAYAMSDVYAKAPQKDMPVAGDKIKIKALLLPKFEVGALAGDFPGEAQEYYEAYFKQAQTYDIKGGLPGHKLYVNKDGLAMYITGMGKLNSGLSAFSILMDPRFDFSKAYVLSIGCAGSAIEYTTMGDVVIGSAVVNYDMGHHVDVRELKNKEQRVAWYPDKDFYKEGYKKLNPELVQKTYGLVQNVKLKTTPITRRVMAKNFAKANWAVRDPKVLRGTIVTGDNYWKGLHDHNKTMAQCQTYGAPDPFAITEMEDFAIAAACERMQMLDRYLAIRVSVNTDVFMNGASPETLWDDTFIEKIKRSDSGETADIFATAMKNHFAVGKVLIENIIKGKL